MKEDDYNLLESSIQGDIVEEIKKNNPDVLDTGSLHEKEVVGKEEDEVKEEEEVETEEKETTLRMEKETNSKKKETPKDKNYQEDTTKDEGTTDHFVISFCPV